MSSVSLQKIVKKYGSVNAVNEINIDIEDGEFIVLLGPSGCGKTTTLRLVAGFVMPTSGRIMIAGRDVTALPPRRRDIGMVFQNYSLFPNMTVAENIAFGLRERKIEKQTIAARVDELLELIRLPGYGGRYSDELSGGQQQRVALARALAFTPRVLLMDEPLGALDRKLREAMQVEIRRIQRELGITTIFVTHDQEEALGLADRIAVMAEGRVEQLGDPEELYRRPRTSFVADFIGKTNFLTGRVNSRSDRRCTVRLEGGGTIAAMAEDNADEGMEVLVATRPELMRISAPDAVRDPGADLNSVAGIIERRRFLGNLGHYFVRTDWGQSLLVEVTGHAAQGEIGERVVVVWDAEASIVYADDWRPADA